MDVKILNASFLNMLPGGAEGFLLQPLNADKSHELHACNDS